MNKRIYQAPKVKMVKLEIKNAILAVCHSSPNLIPMIPGSGCDLTPGCYSGPGK